MITHHDTTSRPPLPCNSDFIFGNETEAAAFSKANDLGTHDVKEIALKLADWEKKNQERPRIAVVTQGAHATVVAINGKVRAGVNQTKHVLSTLATSTYRRWLEKRKNACLSIFVFVR